MARKIQFTLENPSMGGPSNPALVEFTTMSNDPIEVKNAIYLCLMFFKEMSSIQVMDDFSITGIKLSDPDVKNTSVDLPFPTRADVPAIVASFKEGALLAPTATMGTSFLSPSTITVRGSSVNISERTQVGGRPAQGRVYLPFLATAAVDSDGFLSIVKAELIGRAINALFRGVGDSGYHNSATAPFAPIPLAVYSPKLSDAFPITEWRVSRRISVLSSRQR